MEIRDAKFYVIDEGVSKGNAHAEPLDFERAFKKAHTLVENGARVKVLYTEEASQMEIIWFVSRGIPAELISGA